MFDDCTLYMHVVCLYVSLWSMIDISISKLCVPYIHIFCLCCARHDVRELVEVYIYIYSMFCHMYVAIILIECINAAPFILATQEKVLFPCTASRNQQVSSFFIPHLCVIDIISGWWFGTCFIFPYIGNSNPNWLIFFRGVETTNQIYLFQQVFFMVFPSNL